MKEENRQFLEDNIHHLNNARNDYFKNLDGTTRVRFQQIMSEEFRPGYTADIWCDKCALEMMKILGIHYQQWKDAQPKEESVLEPGSVKVHANFPKHKNHRKQ